MSRFGESLGLTDLANSRSSHKGVVPKGGGIGILAAFVFSSISTGAPLAFWFIVVFIALFSLLGDRIELSPKDRLPVQFISAFFFIFLIPYLPTPLNRVPFQYVQLGWSLPTGFWLIFLVVFIVATANWYNFMDGIDGIAGITGLIGFGFLALFSHVSGGDGRFTILSICIALSCLGFLPFNFPKARVFMGDVGSILLGFVFACMVVLLSRSFLDFVILAAFIFPFYADELVTMAVRLKDKENLFKPHRRHFYQLLANEMGIDHWKISVGYGIVQSIVGLSLLSLRPLGLLPILILLTTIFTAFIYANYIIRTRITT